MRSIALALVIFGTIPFILARPYLGLLVWSWLGYMNPHRLTFGFAYSFPWVMLIAIVTLVSLGVSKESKRIPLSATSVLLALFLAWTGITTFFAVVPGSAWDEWQQFAKILVMVFVTLILANTRERLHWLVWVIVVSLGFYGVKGGIFTIFGGGANHVLGPAGSFIGDNNSIALALCMSLPFMRYLQLHSSQKWVRIGLGASMLLTGIAVLGTYSRGGMIALAVVAGALILKGRGRLTIFATLVVIGVVAWNFMPPQWIERMDTLQHATETSSAETRIQSWEFSANVALHRPVLGGGFNVYESNLMWQLYGPEGAKPRAVHSIYFRVLGEQGFVGLVLFLGLLAASWWSCRRVRKQTRRVEGMKWALDLASMLQVSLVAFASAGALLPMSYFDLSYQLMGLSALLVACCTRQLEARTSAGDPEHATPAMVKPRVPDTAVRY